MTRRSLLRPRLLLLDAVLLAGLFLTTLPGRPLAAATDPPPAVDEARMREHLERLDEVLDQRLERLERLPAEKLPTEEERRADTDGLRRHLASLDAMIRRAAPPAADELLAFLRRLERRVRDLERWPETSTADALRPAPRQPHVQPAVPPVAAPPRDPAKGTPANDACVNAQPIGFGTFAGSTLGATNDGEASCGSSLFSPDVWYRFSFPLSGRLFIHAAGTGFEPVISLHTACPGLESEQVACQLMSDAEPLRALEFYASAGEEYLVRVGGRESGTGDFNLTVGISGEITGTVTDAVTGAPLPFVEVHAFDSVTYLTAYTTTGANGDYTLSDLTPGYYFVYVSNTSSYLAEVYDNIPCNSCEYVTGTPVAVVLGQTTSDIDFALDHGGSVTGTVTEEVSGDPISGVGIEVRSLEGTRVGYGNTDAEGRFSISHLSAGSYYVLTSSSGYLDELFDDLPCPYACPLTSGTPVEVSLGQTLSGIDFSLQRLGAISGTVTEAATGDPIPYVDVQIYRQNGSYVSYTRQVSTGSDGTYTTGGLPAGVYFARTEEYDPLYLHELYDDMPCPEPCDVGAGTPITVRLDETARGIDFTLRHLGAITGTVTASVTGAPIAEATIQVRDGDGSFLKSEGVGSNGRYRIAGLPPGDYFLNTYSDEGYTGIFHYLDELYDDLPCSEACDPTAGTPVSVELDGTASGIDFELDATPTISGQVTTSSGAPLVEFNVLLYDSEGSLKATAVTGSTGAYTFYVREPGTYFVQTDGFYYYNETVFLDELYDNVLCPAHEECDPTTGTPITIGTTDVDGINFVLSQLGSISGTVTNAFDGSPAYGSILLWNSAGEFVARKPFGSSPYSLQVLPGTYYATTESAYVDELFDGLPCEGEMTPPCAVTSGTPITVALESTVTGIDFALVPLGIISGRVTDAATGQPAWIMITIWNENGSAVAEIQSDRLEGTYAVGSLPPGRYYVTAQTDLYYGRRYLAELYDDLPCRWEECDPTLGTPVTLSFGDHAKVDFALVEGGQISGQVSNTFGQGLAVELKVWDTSGRSIDYGISGIRSNHQGYYTLTGLETGSYYVATNAHSGYISEIYPDVPCASSGCQPTAGTPIAVTAGETTDDIDFRLTSTGNCSETSNGLCLNNDRFRVELEWMDFDHQGGTAYQERLTDDSGYFYFDDYENVEVVVKVLRACFGPTPRYWVFAGGLTNLEVAMTVTDTITGQSQRYENPLGTAFELVRDTETFAVCDVGLTEGDALATELPSEVFGKLGGEKLGTCVSDDTTLCLGDDRFAVTATWTDATSTPTSARARYLTYDTGYFTFLDPQNVEVVVKVLDACNLAPFFNYWVFATGLTDLAVELRVRDTVSGEEQVYTNTLGDGFVPVQDSAHFGTCP